MPSDEIDQHWMARALEQAEHSVGLAAPNPAVGCVLVKDGHLLAQGFHQYDHRDHAEVVALREAGEQAQGATAYVTLEPCTHHGRTGPCADALIAAGIRRVVMATQDANPVVRGHGAARLQEAGIEVRIGVMEHQARRLNEAFARFIKTSLPFVTMKVASSLDGRIAPANAAGGTTHWITGEPARAEVHRMRHAADALMVGVGTILADDPLLTDRSQRPRRRPLLRVVLDSSLRTPLTSKLVNTAQNDVLIVFTEAPREQQQALQERRVQLLQIAGQGANRLSLEEVLKRLGEMQITSLLLEGGAQLYTTALKHNRVDKLLLFYAPKLLGESALPMLGQFNSALSLKQYELKRFGNDFAIEALLRDPWA